MLEQVTLFKLYPLKKGQKIRIEDGRRQGDWLVVDVDENKVTLRCPVSGRQFSWNRFCYTVATKKQRWPMTEEAGHG